MNNNNIFSGGKNDVDTLVAAARHNSRDTAIIASQTIGNSAGKLTTSTVAKVAGNSGAVGAAISGGIEVLASGYKWANGEIDGEEFACNVARETVGGGIAAGLGTAAASAVSTAAASALAATAAPVWVPAAAAVGTLFLVGTAAKGLWDCIFE